jgi:stage III sporulation protein AD
VDVIAKVVGLAVLATVVLAVLRRERPEWGVLVGVAAGTVLLLAVLKPLAQVVVDLLRLAALGRVQSQYLALILKVLGVAYLASLAAQVARDAGEGMVAERVELAGKVVILLMAVPLLSAILDTLLKWIPGG